MRYGSVDNLGAAHYVRQGFLFSAEDGVLDDPNQVLTIADRNFTFEDGGVSASLEREPGFTVESAMQAAGLDDRSLLNLMACIYTSLVSRTDYPLYLVVSEKEKKMKALIYCIYMALPYSLRYSLSFSDSNNLRRAPLKSVIISENIPAGDSYFCPETARPTWTSMIFPKTRSGIPSSITCGAQGSVGLPVTAIPSGRRWNGCKWSIPRSMNPCGWRISSCGGRSSCKRWIPRS